MHGFHHKIRHGLSAGFPRTRAAFSLVELLVASTIALMVMGAVAQLFSLFSRTLSQSQATVDISGRLRNAAWQLRQDLAGPVYLQLRVGYFFEGEGDLQHGLGLGISPNVTADPTDLSYADGFLEFGQWTLAPSYLLRAWLSDEVQILASFGVPFGLSGTYQSLGLELAVWHPSPSHLPFCCVGCCDSRAATD
jgi:hypothetical protein